MNCNFDDKIEDKDINISTLLYIDLTSPTAATFKMNGIYKYTYFPVTFDSGASLAISPCKEDFVEKLKVPKTAFF